MTCACGGTLISCYPSPLQYCARCQQHYHRDTGKLQEVRDVHPSMPGMIAFRDAKPEPIEVPKTLEEKLVDRLTKKMKQIGKGELVITDGPKIEQDECGGLKFVARGYVKRFDATMDGILGAVGYDGTAVE